MRKAALLSLFISILAMVTMLWPEGTRTITTTVVASEWVKIPGRVGAQEQEAPQWIVTITQPARLLPGKRGHLTLEIQSIKVSGDPWNLYGFASRLEIPRHKVEPNGLTRKAGTAGRAAFHWNVLAKTEEPLQGTLWVYLLATTVDEPIALLAVPVEIPASNRMCLNRQGLGGLALGGGASAGLLAALFLLKGKRRNEKRL